MSVISSNPGTTGTPAFFHGAARLVLVAHLGDDRIVRPDEFDVALFAELRKARIFAQKPVTGWIAWQPVAMATSMSAVMLR